MLSVVSVFCGCGVEDWTLDSRKRALISSMRATTIRHPLIATPGTSTLGFTGGTLPLRNFIRILNRWDDVTWCWAGSPAKDSPRLGQSIQGVIQGVRPISKLFRMLRIHPARPVGPSTAGEPADRLLTSPRGAEFSRASSSSGFDRRMRHSRGSARGKPPCAAVRPVLNSSRIGWLSFISTEDGT